MVAVNIFPGKTAYFKGISEHLAQINVKNINRNRCTVHGNLGDRESRFREEHLLQETEG